ncbi:MAG: hypothetical protein Q4G50_08400 [Corynebacterium sp.]|uniref:hypothetical protein n=1 Tax=Corynebacterium sp. TaxID=1720 RepID=UPI0026DF2E6D|nr:hypothetical protein [Corynebacterium sp.]MDO5670008.1 hypothetical protein [Corynebacterium sp.]
MTRGSTTGLTRRRFLMFTDDLGLPRSVAGTVAEGAVRLTEDAAEHILDAARFDPHRARDLRRVIAFRRRSWD